MEFVGEALTTTAEEILRAWPSRFSNHVPFAHHSRAGRGENRAGPTGRYQAAPLTKTEG